MGTQERGKLGGKAEVLEDALARGREAGRAEAGTEQEADHPPPAGLQEPQDGSLRKAASSCAAPEAEAVAVGADCQAALSGPGGGTVHRIRDESEAARRDYWPLLPTEP